MYKDQPRVEDCVVGVHEPVLRVPVHLRDGAEDVRPGPLWIHGLPLQQVTTK